MKEHRIAFLVATAVATVGMYFTRMLFNLIQTNADTALFAPTMRFGLVFFSFFVGVAAGMIFSTVARMLEYFAYGAYFTLALMLGFDFGLTNGGEYPSLVTLGVCFLMELGIGAVFLVKLGFSKQKNELFLQY